MPPYQDSPSIIQDVYYRGEKRGKERGSEQRGGGGGGGALTPGALRSLKLREEDKVQNREELGSQTWRLTLSRPSVKIRGMDNRTVSEWLGAQPAL